MTAEDFSMPAPLYGLVLTGGRSSRMGQDKARLAYRRVSQVEWSDQLLRGVCERVFVSARPGQWETPPFAGCAVLEDQFQDMGPMAGILTALTAHPDAAWLVLACDLPYLDEATLLALVAGRDPSRDATAFDSTHGGLPEPLCAIYEPGIRARLHELAGQGIRCPRKALLNSEVVRLALPNSIALDNVNHPNEHEQALQALMGRRGTARPESCG